MVKEPEEDAKKKGARLSGLALLLKMEIEKTGICPSGQVVSPSTVGQQGSPTVLGANWKLR